jgi:biotin transport system substrate-specific component
MTSFVDTVRPTHKLGGIFYTLLCLVGGSLFLAFLSQIAIPLWFTPVPITLQSFGVMLLGALLGSKKGALAVILYLIEGGIGLPVFAGGAAGFGVFFGLTGGYLLGFILAAYLIGWLLERGWQESYLLTLTALSSGTIIIWSMGALWLSFFVGVSQALILGVYPFVIGCSLKIIAAATLIPSGWKAIHFFRNA